MPHTVLNAASGQLEEQTSVSGPNSYDATNGFSISTNLPRVDEAQTQISAGSVETRVESIASDNTIVVSVFSAASGGELPADTTLSQDTITYSAYQT